MGELLRLRLIAALCVAAMTLAACGGGSNSSPASGAGAVAQAPQADGAPALTGDIATDGRNWINFRRSQTGLPLLAHSATIDIAARGHSEYQRTNNIVTHSQTAGAPGFTGADLLDRLTAAGYVFANANHAYGEVISASASRSGFFLAEELITAIYHRFVIFEPVFKEVGTGAATTSASYTYFTSNFTANNGYGAGIPMATVAVWPYSGQFSVPHNFFSDSETPDPVAGINEVGYPVSVHVNLNSELKVRSFTMSPRGGSNVAVRLLEHAADASTPRSAAAIVPVAPLAPATTYDVSFDGTVDGVFVTRNWSFTTK